VNDTSWLVVDPVVERVELDGGSWVDVVRGLVPAADEVHDELVAKLTWEQGKVFRYERWIDEPRLYATQSGDARHPSLQEAQTWLMRRYRISLPASVPLALYRDERDSVAFHRDRELRWLEDTVIGVLTLGAKRPWLMKPLGGNGQRTFDDDGDMAGVIDLAPGSGDAQGAGAVSQPDLGAVALDVAQGPPRPQPVLLRAETLQPLKRRRRGANRERRVRWVGWAGPRSPLIRAG
jgi:hypothetical protein